MIIRWEIHPPSRLALTRIRESHDCQISNNWYPKPQLNNIVNDILRRLYMAPFVSRHCDPRSWGIRYGIFKNALLEAPSCSRALKERRRVCFCRPPSMRSHRRLRPSDPVGRRLEANNVLDGHFCQTVTLPRDGLEKHYLRHSSLKLQGAHPT